MILEQFNEFNPLNKVSLNSYIDLISPLDENLKRDYYNYLEEPSFKLISQNNQTRYMLSSYLLEGNELKINIHRTEWKIVNFIWHKYQTCPSFRENLLKESGKSDFLPNSFSLHLMITSRDGMLLMCKISRHKFNDYPLRWAVTIGEQIEFQDIESDNIIQKWIARAIIEEFPAIDDIDRYFSLDSPKILGLEFEDEIYNFALACNIKTYLSTSEFQKYCISNSEIEDFRWLTKEDIKLILKSDTFENYHPTTKDRLQLYSSYYNI